MVLAIMDDYRCYVSEIVHTCMYELYKNGHDIKYSFTRTKLLRGLQRLVKKKVTI